METYNCCTDLELTVRWFKELKEELNIDNKNDLLDCLEFAPDQYPNPDIIKKAAAIVFDEA